MSMANYCEKGFRVLKTFPGGQGEQKRENRRRTGKKDKRRKKEGREEGKKYG